MKKKIICTIAAVAALAAVATGCSKDNASSTASQTTAQSDPVLYVFGYYDVPENYTLYSSADGAFSIQLPNGSTVNDSDPSNVTINIASAFTNPDYINISKATGLEKISSTAQLMELLKNDNGIDITGFFTMDKDGQYEGYKYTYTSIDNPALKGIISTFFADDGSAYIVNATINNGNDESNVTTINSIVDSFINNL